MITATIRSMSVKSWIVCLVCALLLSVTGVLGWYYGSNSPEAAKAPIVVVYMCAFAGTLPVAVVVLVLNALLTKLSLFFFE